MIEKLKPENLNCNIFSCYDYDSFSMQELLCTFFNKINECVNISNESLNLLEWLKGQGLSDEVAKMLNEWLENGKLAEIIRRDVIDNFENRIEENKTGVAEVRKTLVDSKKKEKDVYVPLSTSIGLPQLEFKRKHAVNLYKNLKYRNNKMDFYRNFLGAENSNMYPNIDESKGNDLVETIENNCYKVENNTPSAKMPQVRRFFGAHNLFSTYDISIKDITYGHKSPETDFKGVRCGIDIVNPIPEDNDRYNIHFSFPGGGKNQAILKYEMFLKGESQGVQIAHTIEGFTDTDFRFLITCKEDKFEVYRVKNNVTTFLATIPLPKKLNTIARMTRCRTTLFTRLENGDKVTYTNVENYFDSGISQGDMKPIKYKTGAPLIKNGKIYYTMSSRFQTGAYQTIISQKLSSCEYTLEGVLYYIFDGEVGQDLAASIVYDYDKGEFLVWNTCFSKKYHGLSYGRSYSDLTSGVNFIDMTLMSEGIPCADGKQFCYKHNDEDPDFCFNETTGKWNLIICREIFDMEQKQNMYRYFLFEGDDPFIGYTYKANTKSGTNTGGSIIKVGGKYWLCCGSNYHVRAQYNIYDLDDLSTFKSLIKDVDDGGFRGWGTVIPIPCGNLTKYGWITFDRDQAGEGKWSYGNIYYYESNIYNKGTEYKVKYNI